MSTAVWPPLPGDELKREEEATLARELRWLLASLQDTFASLRAGLEECNALLEPDPPGSTLVVSSTRSETVKGFITRVGTRIVKADINLRLPTLPPPPRTPAYPLRLAAARPAGPATPPAFAIPPLAVVRTLVAQALDVVDAATYTGDAQSAPFAAGQLRLLLDLVQEARATLKGERAVADGAAGGDDGADGGVGGGGGGGGGGSAGPGARAEGAGPWWENPMDESTFDPPLPPTLAVHLSLSDASLVLTFRTLQILPGAPGSPSPHSAAAHTPPSSSSSAAAHVSAAPASGSGGIGGSGLPFAGDALVSLRQRLGLAARLPEHDESGRVFRFRGQAVRVREKARVESQDPGLMSVLAKLGALEYGVRAARANLAALTGEDVDG